MKKSAIVPLFFTITFLFACSKKMGEHNLEEKFIQTEFGNKKISTTINGNQAVIFTREEFKEILRYIPGLGRKERKENNYVGGMTTFDEVEEPIDDIDLKLKEGGIKIKLKIGALKYNCKKGIGFRCGGSVGPYAKIEISATESLQPIQVIKTGRNPDRTYECTVKEINGKYEFEFIEIVDWDWLEKTEI